ncbi:hypothetical protein OAA54_03220 [Pelagibacteraceae bacterium]|jgi:hypothetical protein|nr:hypothetical protein [Pelagibacteraceae bacterium]|tara:strand:- start:1514 stop:1657 length:144 start_codon:yes stop_codon:yes gene_type:complete
MAKVLTAKQKAEELGIGMRALAKSKHLYKHKSIRAWFFILGKKISIN